MNVDLVVVVAVSITLSMKLEWKFPYNVGPEGWVTLSFDIDFYLLTEH